jgi:hypothetical protein
VGYRVKGLNRSSGRQKIRPIQGWSNEDTLAKQAYRGRHSTLRQALINTPLVPLQLAWPTDEGSSRTVNQQVPVVEVVCLGAFVKVAGEGARTELTDIDVIVDCPLGVDGDAPRWYDVRSAVDGMVTTARLWHDVDGSWQILSWHIDR